MSLNENLFVWDEILIILIKHYKKDYMDEIIESES